MINNIAYNNQNAFIVNLKSKQLEYKILILDYVHNEKNNYSISSFFMITPKDRENIDLSFLPEKSEHEHLDFFRNFFLNGHNTIMLNKENTNSIDLKISFYRKVFNKLDNVEFEIQTL